MRRSLLLMTMLGCSATPIAQGVPAIEVTSMSPIPPPVRSGDTPHPGPGPVESAPEEPPPPPRNVERTTSLLKSGLHSPMPGGYMSGYAADTGLDIAGFRLPVYAIAAGTLEYSEPGHTRWTGMGDDDKAVRLRLDEPIPHGDRLVTHVWYAHLRELTYHVSEDVAQMLHVEAGERIGTSGMANGSPHLHIGLLLDGRVSQRWGTYLLEDEVRVVFGGYRARERLPTETRPR